MNEFWTNIWRYPRFFVSSVMGLILIISTPFRALFKVRKLRLSLLILIILLLLIIICILKAMLAV